jgi:hypothetical protein
MLVGTTGVRHQAAKASVCDSSKLKNLVQERTRFTRANQVPANAAGAAV